MALDVHLSRSGNEVWGFRFIGGVDFNMPLTVVKVVPNSPAERAGLQNGDTVSSINGIDASAMTHDGARNAVSEAKDVLKLEVMRGLYDPVLDDQEPILEYEPDDFDRSSQPTEVQFEIQNFDAPKLTESRSLTASPFVLPTKPYRPFSTDPLPIPPLEDPIILNPNYRDNFGKYGHTEDLLFDSISPFSETKFKLPISEQYDPDGTRKKSTKHEEYKFSKEFKQEMMTNEEIKFIEQMKQEIDLEKIELTATNIVDESIERALNVTEEIKKEIDFEMRESSLSSSEFKQSTTESKATDELVKSSKVHQLADLIDKTTEEIVKQNGYKTEVNVAKEVKKFETVDKQGYDVEERKISTQQEIDETIVAGSVKRKSIVFNKESEIKVVDGEKDVPRKVSVDHSKQKEVRVLQSEKKEIRETNSDKEAQQKVLNTQKSGDSKTASNSKISTSKLLAEQRAYTIGLQTIPNIRGSIHSSYHYNLLLKTFFIHLTDVMVALSRFILSEPVFKSVDESREVKESITKEEKIVEESVEIRKEEIAKENVAIEKKEEKEQEIDITQSEIIDKQDIDVEVEQILESAELKEDIQIRDSTDTLAVGTEGEVRKRKLSGAKMAQLVERKSAELTQKMDAVISEFQTKTGIEELAVQQNRRSRSRSKVEEEVLQESDPLEWLSKTESGMKSQAVTEVTNTTEVSKRFMESVDLETRKIESRYETKEVKVPKSKEGKNTYIAIVEAHVYTNKDAILEEHLADISETASIQSAEETNISLETNNTLVTEKVAIESSQSKEEVAKSSVEGVREFSSVSAVKNKDIEIVEEKAVEQEVKESIKEISYEKKETEIEKKELAVQETLQIVEPVVEIQETKNSEVAVIEGSIEVSVESAKEKIIIEEPEIKDEPIVVEATVAVHPKKNDKPLQEEFAELKIVKKIEIEDDSEVQIVEIEDSELEKRNYESIQSYAQDNSVEQSIHAQSYQALSSHTEETSIEQTFQSQELSQAIIQKQCQAIQQAEYIQEESQAIQESSFTAKSTETDATKKLTLQTDLRQEQLQTQTSIQSDENNNIDTPTPSTVPPTPLTDEYVFRLAIPLPKSRSTTPVPRDPTPEREHDEDPHIVKKKLIPHIETSIESVIYDPPLPTPPAGETLQSPVYAKPGLKGGADREEFTKEEIKEIERKSSLLASAIDETIKSIEEYKEEVGIETKNEIKIEKVTKTEVTSKKEVKTAKEMSEETKANTHNDAVKAIEDTIIGTKESQENQIQKEWVKVDEQIKRNDENVNELIESLKESSEPKELNKNMVITDEAKEISNVSNNTDNVSQEIDTINKVVIEKEETEVQNSLTSKTEATANKQVTQILEASVNHEMDRMKELEESWEKNKEILQEVKPVQFNPLEIAPNQSEDTGFHPIHLEITDTQDKNMSQRSTPVYVTETGEVLGTTQGFVDGLEDAVVDEEVAKELGKPGMSEEQIAELISGEAEMLREAHVMGLSRVLTSHMHRATDDDDSSVDFKKIKPVVESLKDSEVLKALNEDLARTKAEKKREEERRWTTFLQKPKKPVPRAKFGYHGYIQPEEIVEEPYRVKIVKQPKPKIAPDYKPEDFDTGPLPWEQRALTETPPPPVEPEEPILVPEEGPEFLEAVDPLPESEVPDLEDTGIPLPPPEPEQSIVEEPTPTEEHQETAETIEENKEGEEENVNLEAGGEGTNAIGEEMEQNQLAEQLMRSVQSMVDPNATLEQQLAQMRVQLAALAQLPGVIQQTLELVTKQLSQLTHSETTQKQITQELKIQQTINESYEEQVNENHVQQEETLNSTTNNEEESLKIEEMNGEETIEDKMRDVKRSLSREEVERMQKEESEMIEEQKRIEKQKKELMEQARKEHESRQASQRSTPRPGKPKPVFGPLNPEDRPVILPGGRRWRGPKDVYDEQLIAETLSAQAEIIKGKAKGFSFESALLPYDERINFMKYEKPPVTLDHLKDSEVYKLIHNMEQAPVKRVELLTPVIAESDYREKCRSLSPCADRMSKEEHVDIPQQVQP